MVVKGYPNELTIKHATLIVEDEHGNVMRVEIDTDRLNIINYLSESEYRWPDPVALNMPARHVGSQFTLYTHEQYIVTYDKKEKV
jgi:hypothetical protein